MDTIYDNEMDTSYCLVDMEEIKNQPEDRTLLILVVLKNSLSPFYPRYVSFRSHVACAGFRVSWIAAKGRSKSRASFARPITDIKAHVCDHGNATMKRALGWVSRHWPDLVCFEESGSQIQTETVFQPTTNSITIADEVASQAFPAAWSRLASSSVSSLSSNNSSVSALSFCSTVYNTSVDDNVSEAATESLDGSDPDGADDHMSMGVILEPSPVIAQ